MTHKYSKCFHTCILFLINMVTCVYMGSHNHFKFKIVKENLQRVIRKLFQCNLVSFRSWHLWMMFVCRHLFYDVCAILLFSSGFIFWVSVYWILVHREFAWDYSSVNVLFLWPKSGGIKTNSRLQKYVIYNCIEIL